MEHVIVGDDPLYAGKWTRGRVHPTYAAHMLSRVPTVVLDVGLACAFVALTLVEQLAGVQDGFRAGGTVASLVVLVPFCACLVLRRRAPLLCLSLMLAWYSAAGLVVRHSGFAFATSLPLLVVTYTVARYADRRWAWVGLTSGPVFWLGTLLADGTAPKVLSSIWFDVVTTVVAWGTGTLLRQLAARDEQLREAQDRLEAEQAQRAAAAVRAERARIALEMHDVVSASVAQMLARLDEEVVRLGGSGDDVGRLASAREAGERALVELGGMHASEQGPVPSLADASSLVAHYRDAGLEVSWSLDGVDDVPTGASSTAYRILQEALTNALKHGADGRVLARVRHDGTDVVVEVRNDVATAPSSYPSGRNGLLGMRERVAVFGGTLHAEATDGAFEVRAVLPVRGAR